MNRRQRVFLACLVLVLTAALQCVAVPVTLIKHDNSEIKGDLVSISGKEIVVDDQTLPRDEVKKILYDSPAVKKEETGATGEAQTVSVRSDIPTKDLIALAQKAAQEWPDAGYITLVDTMVAEYIDANNSVNTYHAGYIILKDDFKWIARVASWVNESRMRFEVIYGRIIYPDGTEFYMNPADMVKSVPKDQGAAFFSSSGAVLYYNFPQPSAGCIIEYKTRRTSFLPYVEDMFSSRFGFNGDQPVISSILEVVMPEGKPLHYVSRNMTAEEEKPEIAARDGKTVYRWAFGRQEAIIEEPSMPHMGDICKRIYYSNQGDIDFLFDWKQKMLGKNIQVTPLIEETVAEILKDVPDDTEDSEEEKVRHLYHWVQTEIRYVSVKSGSMSGMAGHPAAETLKNNFGDCVDKSVLFCAMLRAAGVEAYPLSINTNPDEEMETRIPIFDANHSITEVILKDGRSLVLDTTTTNHTYPSFRSDDHGVPVFNAMKERIFRAPVPPPENNRSEYHRQVAIDASGQATVQFRGDYTGPRSAQLRGYYKTVPEKDLEKVFLGMTRREMPDAKLHSYRVENIYDLFKEVFIEYSYSSNQFLMKAGNLYIMKNVSTLPFYFDELAPAERKYPIEYMTSLRRTNHDTYTLAPNFEVMFLPEPIEVKNDYVYYKGEYSLEGRTLTFTNHFDRLKRLVPAADYRMYKKSIQQMLDFEKQNVILKRNEPKNYADILILRDGQEIDGELVKAAADALTFELKDGSVKTYANEDVLSVEVTRTSGEALTMSLDRVMDKHLQRALNVKATAEEYPGTLKVILLDRHHYRLNNDGTCTYTTRVITRVLEEEGKAAGFDNWNFDPETEKLKIDHARTINGNEVSNLSSRTVKTALEYSAYPEYQRLTNIKFALPKVNLGSTLDYQVSRIVTLDSIHHPFGSGLDRNSAGDQSTLDAGSNESWLPPPACFYPVVPVVKKELVFDVPEDFEAKTVILNNDGNLISGRREVVDGRCIHTFTNTSPMEARVAEEHKPPVSCYWPLVMFEPVTTWEKLHAEIKDRFTVGKDDLTWAQVCLDGLKTKHGRLDLDIIYNFVAMELHHLPIGLRDYAVAPKSVAEILKNKKASQLDAAWLLTVLIRAHGYEAHLGLVPPLWFTRSLVPGITTLRYFEVPVVKTTYKNKIYFLYASNNLLGMKDSAVGFQNRDVMVITGKGLEFETIPKSDRNLRETTLTGSLDESGALKVELLRTRALGSSQKSYRELRSILKEKWRLIAENIVNQLHPNAVLKSFLFDNVDRLEKDVTMDLTFDIPNYCNVAGTLYFMKLPGVDYDMPRAAAPPERINADIDLGTPFTSKSSFRIALPEDFKPYYLPEAVDLENESMVYRAGLKVEDGHLVFEEVYTVKQSTFPREQYRLYQEFCKARTDFSKEYIIFEKTD